MSETEQSKIDTYSEMNRYDERDEDWPSAEVFEEPRRTLHNYWAKFHATRDCGARNVALVEDTNIRSTGDKYEFRLRCWDCGYRIDEDEVLFIGGDWYSKHGWQAFGRPVEDLNLPRERVLELGPDPDRNELVQALNLTRIEREASFHGVTFGNESYRKCVECHRETMIRFDERCRMCYDGVWTDRMSETIAALARCVRERNGSFVHRLEKHIDPLSIKGRAFEGKILWRRHKREQVSKLVEVTQCLRDDSDGHWEYVLTDPTHTSQWRYHEEDLADCFWDTGLYNEEVKPVMDDRIREVYQRVCEHSFHEVHDPETHEVSGEQCTHCRKKRAVPRED